MQTARIALLIFTAGISAQATMLTNGDFEACATAPLGTACPPWTFATFAGAQTNGTGGFAGNPGNYVRLEASGLATSDPTATATVGGLTVGEEYVLAWDWAMRINFSGSTNGPSFGVFLDSQTFASALFLGTRLNSAYATDSVTITATSASHTFIFAGELDGRSNGAGTTDVSYRLDNATLDLAPSPPAAVPEPATLALAGLALILLRCRRRRGCDN